MTTERHVNPWLIAVSVMFAPFMEGLDTTVVNVSLPHIAGSLSATIDEATWALTSYLVANAIILPMTGWLANFFGRKRLLLASVAGFTIASFLCGIAPNLPTQVFFRVIQGACGGGLQPLSQAILMETFPPQDRGKAMAFWALGIVVAPMLGPVLGGWITDSYSWRWVFYINLPIGIAATVMTMLFVSDPEYIKRREGASIDYWGMGFLAVGIGALQVLLDKGQEEDWFSSNFVRTLMLFAVAGLVLFVIRELMAEHPVVDLRVFRVRTYSTGVFIMTVLGFVLYGSIVLLPIWLQQLMGYSSLDAGMAMLPRGLGAFLFMPAVGYLMGKVEARKLLATGIVIASYSLFMLAHLNLNAGYWDVFLPQLIQGFAMGLLFVPLTTITNDPIPKAEMGNAASIFNLMRNIGASFGIAAVTTVVARHTQTHSNVLAGHITPFDVNTQRALAAAQANFIAKGADAATAARMAYASIFGMIQRNASMMAFIDVFRLLGILFLLTLPLILFMKPPKGRGGGMAH